MFTGIIQSIGTIRAARRAAGGMSFRVDAPGFVERLSPGDSIDVNGACQTVDAVKRTTLGRLSVGDRVNLEAAATLETPLGGHMVQGHVDGVGRVESFVKTGQDWILSIRIPDELTHLVVPKGSIAIDGVSLTVMEVPARNVIKITIVPFTVEHTIICAYRSGTLVNVETDIIGKYVISYLERSSNRKMTPYM
jgi:riboflavin synthase